MRAVEAKLYGMNISHPSWAARFMLEHKGIEHEWVAVMPGHQAVRMPLAGFRGGTVPALRMNGKRVVGTRNISRFLDQVQPEPPLFPADAVLRGRVEGAEAWGEEVLQPIPRRLLRWAVRNDPQVRVMFAEMLGMPAPKLVAPTMVPFGIFYSRREEAHSQERIRADFEALPGHLDHIDELIADGVLGGEQLNAADFQIATTLRVMLAMEDYTPLISGRPAEDLARRVWPDYDYSVPSLSGQLA